MGCRHTDASAICGLDHFTTPGHTKIYPAKCETSAENLAVLRQSFDRSTRTPCVNPTR
jgi:hypothetical protein